MFGTENQKALFVFSVSHKEKHFDFALGDFCDAYKYKVFVGLELFAIINKCAFWRDSVSCASRGKKQFSSLTLIAASKL